MDMLIENLNAIHLLSKTPAFFLLLFLFLIIIIRVLIFLNFASTICAPYINN